MITDNKNLKDCMGPDTALMLELALEIAAEVLDMHSIFSKEEPITNDETKNESEDES